MYLGRFWSVAWQLLHLHLLYNNCYIIFMSLTVLNSKNHSFYRDLKIQSWSELFHYVRTVMISYELLYLCKLLVCLIFSGSVIWQIPRHKIKVLEKVLEEFPSWVSLMMMLFWAMSRRLQILLSSSSILRIIMYVCIHIYYIC